MTPPPQVRTDPEAKSWFSGPAPSRSENIYTWFPAIFLCQQNLDTYHRLPGGTILDKGDSLQGVGAFIMYTERVERSP